MQGAPRGRAPAAPHRQRPLAHRRDVVVAECDAHARDRRELHAVLQAELVDLVHLAPLDRPADGGVLEPAFERENDRLGQTGVHPAWRQADDIWLYPLRKDFASILRA